MVRGTGPKTGDCTQWFYLRRYYSLDCSLWRFGWDFCMHFLIHSGVSEGLPKVSSFPVGAGFVPVWRLSQRPQLIQCGYMQIQESVKKVLVPLFSLWHCALLSLHLSPSPKKLGVLLFSHFLVHRSGGQWALRLPPTRAAHQSNSGAWAALKFKGKVEACLPSDYTSYKTYASSSVAGVKDLTKTPSHRHTCHTYTHKHGDIIFSYK